MKRSFQFDTAASDNTGGNQNTAQDEVVVEATETSTTTTETTETTEAVTEGE